MLRYKSSNTTADGPTVEEDVFFVHFEDLIDEVIHCEGILLEPFGVFRLIPVKAVPWVFHGQNANSKALSEAIQHVVAHAKVLRIGMEVQHNLTGSIFKHAASQGASSCYTHFLENIKLRIVATMVAMAIITRVIPSAVQASDVI